MFEPRDEWSCKTHLAGAVLGALATVSLIVVNIHESTGRLIAMTVFGISIIALYSCSAIYHYSKGTPSHIEKLRKLDHSMIFVLISGTYTPIMYICLPEKTGIIFLTVLWIFAAAGVVMKILWLYAPRWLYTLIYLVMGWSIIFDFHAFISLPNKFIAILLAGGIAYTIGAVMYAMKKPNPSEKFGFHEIFHVFIIIGTTLHFIGIAFMI